MWNQNTWSQQPEPGEEYVLVAGDMELQFCPQGDEPRPNLVPKDERGQGSRLGEMPPLSL